MDRAQRTIRVEKKLEARGMRLPCLDQLPFCHRNFEMQTAQPSPLHPHCIPSLQASRLISSARLGMYNIQVPTVTVALTNKKNDPVGDTGDTEN